MRRGQGALEYIILFGFIAVMALAILLTYSTGGMQSVLENYITKK